ncbi:MAG: hypothetical protein PHG89_08980 [Gallionella sp.]|nr:hypothetical protein [Gallionella sp.]
MNMLRRKKIGTGNGGETSAQADAPGRAMSRLAKSFVLFVSLIWLGAWSGNAQAAIITSTATGGLWSVPATWVGGVAPLTTDSAVIATTGVNAVTLGANTGVVALTINTGGTLNLATFRIRPTGATSISGTINIGTSTASRFAGLVTINTGGVWSNASNVAVNFRGGLINNGGTFTAGTGIQTFNTTAQAIGGTSPITIPNLTVATVAVTNNGNLTVSTALAGTTGSLANATATSVLNLGGTSAITTLTATAAGNTVNYTGAAQTLKATAYSNLGLSGSGIKTLTTVTTVGGNLTMSGTATATTAAALAIGGNLDVGAGTTLTVGAFNIGVTGTTSVSGILAHSSATGTKTYTGAVTINSSGSLTNAGNAAITYGGGLVNTGSFASGTGAQTFINGGITHNGTAFTAGTGAFTFSTNPQAINCATALTIPSITVTTITVTNNCNNLTMTTALAGTGNFTNGVNSQLHYNSTTAIGVATLTASATGNLVDYGFAGVQTLDSPAANTYYHLTLSGSGIKTMPTITLSPTITVLGDFTMSGTAATSVTALQPLLVSGNFTLNTLNTFTAGVFAHSVGGNWSNGGTFTAGASTVTFNGTVQQTLTGATTFNNMTVNNAAGLVLASDITATSAAAGVVTLTSGTVTTGANTLIIPRSCATPSVSRTGGWVNGNLRKAIPAGASTCNFEVGDATNYTPVSTTFAAGTTAGNLTASTVGTQHPSITDPSSGLATTNMVNRYWTLTNGGVGLPVAGYSATFNFINATPVDLTTGATPANFEVENWSGAAWSATTAGTRTASSTQANSLTAFGAFAVGEKKPPTVVSITCVVSCTAATNAATVSWTVTFSKSVTGVDATDFALVATGVSGTFITGVTGSGTTWTVTANTGIGSGTLGLNLVDDDTIIDAGGRKLGGTGAGNGNATGEVYTITATSAQALSEYRMDEASWNGTANEVTDNSGSGNHAQSFNSANTGATTPAIAGSPGTCRYGVFNNGTTITQAYVQTPLPHLTADFTVTAWIYPTNVTYVGSRIFADDLNGSSGYGFSIDDGAGHVGFYDRGVSPVSFPSNYALANNTWYFVAAVADITNKIRTIYVFNSAGTLLNTTTGAFTGTWTTGAGSVTIGSTQSYYFQGNLDEVRVYQKVLNQTALTAIATQTHVCPINVPDHIRIEHDGSAISCSAEAVVVKACSNADCSILYTGGVSGNLTAGGNSVAFSIASGQSQTTVNIHLPSNSAGADPQTVRLGTSSVSPVPTDAGSPYCSINAGAANNTTACDVSVYKAGFLFDVPHLTSGTASGTVNISAVRSSDSSTCVPLFQNVTRTVAFWGEYQNPSSGTLSLQVNGSNIETTATPAYTSTYSLTFGAAGVATLTSVRYDDVGLMQLNARYVGSTGNTPPDGGMIALGSDTFVVAPHHFGFSGIAAGPIKAGNNFAATVTALNSAGVATPNFGKETAPEGVTLTSTLVTPNPVTYPTASNPTPGNNVISGTEFGAGGMVSDANGVATVNNLNWGEVGSITLTANLTSGSYLGSGLNATGTSATVGAFIPEHFDTAVVATATVPMPCPTGLTCPTLYDGFIYSGQPFSVQVTAKNLVDNPTANYHGIFGLSNDATLSAWDALGSTTTQNPGPGALANNTVVAAAFSAGVGTTATPTYTLAAPTAPTNIFVRAVDSVNAAVTSLRATPSNSVEGGVKVVSGRVKTGNAHGSELLQLPMTATVQYYDGANWLKSDKDSVTSLTPSLSNYQCKTGCAWTTTPIPASGQIIVGILSFKLSKPTGGGTGSVDVSISAPDYLLAGSNGAAVNPSKSGRATFGVYKGNNEFIYLREVY